MMTVGLTLLTRMPYWPSSRAHTRVMLSSVDDAVQVAVLDGPADAVLVGQIEGPRPARRAAG